MSQSWLCPLRPQPPSNGGGASDGVIEGWDNIEDADVLRDPEATVIGAAEDREETSALDGSSTQMPVGAPEPPQPSKAEVARHNLTHINYRTWCPHCVMARRPAAQHRSNPHSKRNVPLFCADYCFVRDSQDEELATLLVGRLYPSRSFFATVTDSKGGEDTAAIQRLSSFFKESGIQKLVYKTDQESSIKVMVDDALHRTGKSGVFESYESVPEYSAVGASPSNGRAERAVQTIEDQLRTLKSAIGSRTNPRIPSDHPVMRWLVEHSASPIESLQGPW